MDGYDFEKLAREIVAGRMAGLAERAPETAAEITRRILISALQSTRTRQDPRQSVMAVSRGALGGLLLINQDLVAAAPLILKEMAAVAHEVPLSPEDLMTWSMEGMAQVAVVSGRQTEYSMSGAIEAAFMGAGAVFDKACAAAQANPA